MTRRALSVALLVLGAGAGASAALPAAGGSPPVGPSLYVVQLDPRLCPSPLCGGYWVALANRSRTRCSDGARRQRCYVARAVDEERHPLSQPIADGSLVRGDVESWRFEGFGDLGALVVARVFTPAGIAAQSGRYFRVADTGVRCVRAPCFSLRASQLNRDARTTLSGADLGAAGLQVVELRRATVELTGSSGLLVRGRVVATADGGRELRATRVFLREPRPRA